jgi:hypothetical protein
MGRWVGAIVLFITGCATVHQTYAPDGRKAFSLNCSGTARGWDKCHTAAGELCGAAGYDILDRSSEDVAHGGATGANAFVTKTHDRSMLIACKTNAHPPQN